MAWGNGVVGLCSDEAAASPNQIADLCALAADGPENSIQTKTKPDECPAQLKYLTLNVQV
jgi:hypothetical protein